MTVEEYARGEEENETEELLEWEAEQRYEDFLDELYGEIETAGMTFWTGRALKELDPTAFRCGMLDWADSEGIEIA